MFLHLLHLHVYGPVVFEYYYSVLADSLYGLIQNNFVQLAAEFVWRSSLVTIVPIDHGPPCLI